MPDKSIRDLIDEMKGKTPEAKTAAAQLLEQAIEESAPKDADIIEAPNADGIRELSRQLALIKLQKASLDATEKSLATALKALAGGHKGVAAHGQRLYTVTYTDVERVNTEMVKETFPIEKFPDLYTVTKQQTLLLDPDFKKSVAADAATQAIEEAPPSQH